MAKKKRKKKRGMPLWLVILLSVFLLAMDVMVTWKTYLQKKYGDADEKTALAMYRQLDENSLEYKDASKYFTQEQLDSLHALPKTVAADESLNTVSEEDVSMDPNGDGIHIEHIYGPTYEGYMMVIDDPADVFIALNPGMSQGLAGPTLPEYLEYYDAVAGINAGGFIDVGGFGDGSQPAGIVIMNGRIVQGGYSAVIAFTADHRLIATTTSAEALLDMGVEEAITFGPTFIHNGQVVYTSADGGSLNITNPRTAVGMKEDGTMLFLVIDGRGPSSWGCKYEDVIDIMQDYGAVEAGNLDGGNSSAMMYLGKYVNYTTSMDGSRYLPDAILVRKGGRKNG